MNTEHIKIFDRLYAKMSESSDIKDMELFGKVMREAMTYVIEHSPAHGEELLEKLTAIEYCNFLTKKEAEEIIAKMEPTPKWSIGQMRRMLEESGAPTEEAPYYNDYALLTVMSMVASDSMGTLVKYVDGDDRRLLELCYHLALDKLKDKDKVFCVRSYFGV